ncbi:FkbM family methyltransferase [uncultured Roseobacter sp.]|uniref:FkbM family methyltransferase n=1 Tax=uncultured Roseobacter sp. TaxID=114847 RepID=UPI002631C734|nr:FkbM family methyltransferase [uncultured Roseobacter sp.]
MDGAGGPVADQAFACPAYEKTLKSHGILVPYVPAVVSDRMKDVLVRNRYEAGEIATLRQHLEPDDILLEVGGGIGMISTLAAGIVGPENVTVVEANPELIPLIRETHALNDMTGVRVLSGIGVPEAPEADAVVDFHLRDNFWASSLLPPRPRETVRTVPVPLVGLNDVIRAERPTVLFMDIEGAELDVLGALDLSSFRFLVVEVHHRVYGLDGISGLFDAMAAQGFTYDPKRSRGGSVVVFSRFRPAPVQQVTTTAITCMKDEGPFILEWIAHHRAIGVTGFLIFSNDCTDGTVPLLNRLDEMGIIRHLPNPSTAMGTERHQPTALAYAGLHPEVQNADWVISMDVDEFLNIHAGDGTLGALYGRLPDADVISLSHVDFGDSGIEHFSDGLITDRMQYGQVRAPDKAERRGIKTLVSRHAPPHRLSNHRPYFDETDGRTPVWYDGSGRPCADTLLGSKAKGLDCRDTYNLAQINHYPVRDMETYLTKAAKGDVVAVGHFVGIDYWARRNRNDAHEASIQKHLHRLRAGLKRLLEDDQLRALHEAAVAQHRNRIAVLKADEASQALLENMRKASLSDQG